MRRTAKAFEKLHPKSLEAARSRSLSGTFDGRRLLEILGELATIDDSTEAAIAKARSTGGKFGLATFIGVFIGVFFTAFTGLWMILLIPAATGVLAIRSLHAGRRLRLQSDLLDDFRLLIRPLLRDLLADIDPEKKVRVRLDLTGNAPGKQVSKRDLPPGHYQKLVETVHRDPWCELRLPLADGSTAIVEVMNEYHKFERRYRTARGKIKWKSKWRKDAAVSATLLPPPGVEWRENVRSAVPGEKVKAFEKDGAKGMRLERSWSFKGNGESVIGTSPPYREVVGMLLRLHGALAVPGRGVEK